jgi:hypothetical protein
MADLMVVISIRRFMAVRWQGQRLVIELARGNYLTRPAGHDRGKHVAVPVLRDKGKWRGDLESGKYSQLLRRIFKRYRPTAALAVQQEFAALA